MIPQEQQLLEDFLNRLATTPATARDPQASALIQQRLASLPDPGYLLVQRAILLEQALKAAQAQISQLQAARARIRPPPAFWAAPVMAAGPYRRRRPA